ncbi:sensor histidine kinase [Sphingomonas arantia]|uniref:histidine kinase n=1 Tax=Sphingomonas arantia TaxID=1460676 RepID=A0ABW4TXY0_9SPHN
MQLQQVIVNLVLNSAQALAQAGMSNGHISLTTEEDKDGLIFEIEDDGPGIADENIDHIFDGPFTTKEEGMGVGLVICQSIVASHGGSIAASNESEGGARFRLWLPSTTLASRQPTSVIRDSGSASERYHPVSQELDRPDRRRGSDVPAADSARR